MLCALAEIFNAEAVAWAQVKYKQIQVSASPQCLSH